MQGRDRNAQFIVLAGKSFEHLWQIRNKLLLSGCIFPPTVSCNVEGMKKKNTGRKEQHIKTASSSLQRGKIKCFKSCFAWVVATLNALLHHHDGHCKAYIASKSWKTKHNTLDKKSLNTSTKHISPSLCEGATKISYSTEHNQEQKKTGPETELEAKLQHRCRVCARDRAEDRTGVKQWTCIQKVLPGDDQPTSICPKSIEEIGPETRTPVIQLWKTWRSRPELKWVFWALGRVLVGVPGEADQGY